MKDLKEQYIEWSKEHGCYCGTYEDGSLIGNDARIEFDAFVAGRKSRQNEIDQLKNEKSLQELEINQIAQVNQEWQRLNQEKDKRIESAYCLATQSAWSSLKQLRRVAKVLEGNNK
ncbi:hypothetical protein [Acinetobacter wuhouensis]|uniref:Uncharacterized protein n=1 Tax=Acinetobacter wuhouensis TaxID=1879050 RepID=A0A4Q7AH02_9GAMM|nr:hypothetical protein [Acinetobacter wuhouensis]RZG47025.1 hypothetical protein EXU28_07505 [Acinetobacter wuhouensis]